MDRQSAFSHRYLILSDPSTSPPTPRKQWDRLQGDVELGRASKSDSAANDPHSGKFRTSETKVMSSRHAKITWENGCACLTDVGSTNGTAISREGEKRTLEAGVSYRVKDGDVITFGRQVDHRQTIVCKPVVLVATFSSQSAFPTASVPRSSFATRSPAPSCESASLVRSRTLTDRLSASASVGIFDDEDDEDSGGATQRVPPSTLENRAGNKRVGFGLSEEDVLISDEDDAGDIEVVSNPMDFLEPKLSFEPPRLPAVASKAESVASVAAVSSLSVRGSPVPDSNNELLELELEADTFSNLGSAHHADEGECESSVEPVVRLPSPISPEDRRDSRASSSRPASEGVYAASRKLVDQLQPKQRRLGAFLSSDDERAMLSGARPGDHGDGEEEDEPELVELAPPTGLFDRPQAAVNSLESFGFNVNRFKQMTGLTASEAEEQSQPGSHLPSPVLSPKSDDIMVTSDEEDEGLRPADMPPPKQLETLFKDQAVARDASPAVSDLAGSQFFLPTPALATTSLPSDLGADHESYVNMDHPNFRARTPVGRGFSPPTTSPIGMSLKAYLDDLDEEERLVRDAETEEPEPHAEAEKELQRAPSSLFEEDESGRSKLTLAEVEAELASLDEFLLQNPPASAAQVAEQLRAVEPKPAPVKIKWTFAAGRFQKEETPKRAPDVQMKEDDTPVSEEEDEEEDEPEEEEQESPESDLSELDDDDDEEEEEEEDDNDEEEDPIEDPDSDDFEADVASPLAVDPDLDAVDLDVDVAVAKDEDEGLSSGDEVDDRDGMGVEEERWEDGVSEKLEQEEVEKAVSEDEDDGYTSEGKVVAPHAVETPLAPTTSKASSVADSPLLDPTMFDSSSTAASSPRKRRLSDTDFETPSSDDVAGKKQTVESKNADANDPSLTGGIVSKAAAAAVALEEPAPKRRRVGGGFAFKTFALGLATGMVAAIGGLSALGAMLEEDF
ncbi:hypothetical protein JCM6882_001867 [Rhodosporidiobolus microsporus]